MTQFWSYRNPFGTTLFNVDLGNTVVRLGELAGLTEMAEHLQAGSTTVTFDDPSANLGHSGDAIEAQARIAVRETAAPSNSQRLYNGVIGVRGYGRNEEHSLITGAQREIQVELFDLNALPSLRVIPNSDHDAIRPAETVTLRMAWITGANYMNGVVDLGFVAANSTVMTPNDYRGQRPSNVINDCEMAAGFGWNAFVYAWDEAEDNPGLFFDNANTSTAFSSTIRISNVLADVDVFTSPTATTFAPSIDARLRRDPSDLGSDVYMPYKNSAVYVESAATYAIYGHKAIIAPNSNVSTKARALAQAKDFAFQHSTEDDRITVTVELPPSKVNLVRAGMRMQVKFQHLPGYESFTWCRVLSRSPGQTKETDDRYFVRLELSPQEEPCGEVTDFTPFVASMSSGLAGDGASGSPILNINDCIDGNALTYTNFQAGGAGGAVAPTWWITADMGSAVTLTEFTTLANDTLGSSIEFGLTTPLSPSPPNQFTRFLYSTDGSVYHELSVTKTFDDGLLPTQQTWTFAGPITARYWRLLKGGKQNDNTWGSITLYEWGLIGTDCPESAQPPVPDPDIPTGSIPANGGTGTTLDKDFADGVLDPFVIQTYPNDHPGDDMIEYGIFAPGQVSVHDGYLDLRATKQADGSYLQGFVATFNVGAVPVATFDFQYGTVTAVMRMNDGQGAWQGFWLLISTAWTAPEIDWPELISGDFTANIHGSSNDGQDVSETFASGWHEYTIVKTSTDLTFKLDGATVGTTVGANMTARMALMADAKVGPPGTAPDGTTPDELYLHISTIRVDP